MSNAANADIDTRQVRTVLMEQDAATDAKSVVDIREFDLPTKSVATSWTALGRDADHARRALLLDISRQIDQLVAGEIAEIVIVVAA